MLELLRILVALVGLGAVLYVLCSLAVEAFFGCDIDGLDDDGAFDGADDARDRLIDEVNGVRP